MKYFIILFIIAVVGLQYKLWFGEDSITELLNIKTKIEAQEKLNKQQAIQNQNITADIEELRHADQALEENARESLGMTKNNEVYYQLAD
ncbi:MAG: hypothetical protein A3F18_01715 [Legionellales bacterium RIFCSPHIGHO2_12_FULL_37_14]|nr:MAG: hypothetical protein A3F18_01715 [Legionellales bacterium RIFCSPHIGHO2_12_FULL_37_14]